MNHLNFKELFNTLVEKKNFHKAFDGWFLISSESIVVLDLQKSNYGDYYELNIKIYIQGLFGNKYIMSKDLVKKHIGNIFLRPPNETREIFNLENDMSDGQREKNLENLLSDFIMLLANKALTREGIKELIEQNKVATTPAVREELFLNLK